MVAQKAQRLTIDARQGMIEEAIPEPGVWVSRSLVMPQNQQSALKDGLKRMENVEKSRAVPYIKTSGLVGFTTAGKLAKTARKKTATKVPTTKR
jgi:hypothetical protein